MNTKEVLIGIITYNRLSLLRQCLNSIYRNNEEEYSEIVVSDDGDSEETISFLQEEAEMERLHFITKPRGGVARNSNRILNYFLNETNAKYLFLLNDDIQITKASPSCFRRYIRAYEDTGIEHFSYLDQSAPHKVFSVVVINNHVIKESRSGDGCFMFFTRKAIETLGGFDIEFGLYGCEHADMSRRASFAGMTTSKNVVNDIEVSEQLIYVPQYNIPIPSSIGNKERNLLLSRSVPKWHEMRTLPPKIWKPIVG